MANIHKVKRGMVFWYDLDDRIDKHSNPTIQANGREYRDHRQFGLRHWLITSNNDGNNTSPTCNAVPITSANQKADIPVHVKIIYHGRPYVILCEQMTTINMVSLRDYVYTISESDMEKVSQALQIQYNLRQKAPSPEHVASAMLNRVESQIRLLTDKYENHMLAIANECQERLMAISAATALAADGDLAAEAGLARPYPSTPRATPVGGHAGH